MKVLKTTILIGVICIDAHIVAVLRNAICIALDMDQGIVSTIHIAGRVKKILVLLIHNAATATNDIDRVIYIAIKGVYIKAFDMHCGMTAQNIE